MNKFVFFNDTKREVGIHPATFAHGCQTEDSKIKPMDTRTFILPEGTYAWVKMWDYGDLGLQIMVSPQQEEE